MKQIAECGSTNLVQLDEQRNLRSLIMTGTILTLSSVRSASNQNVVQVEATKTFANSLPTTIVPLPIAIRFVADLVNARRAFGRLKSGTMVTPQSIEFYRDSHKTQCIVGEFQHRAKPLGLTNRNGSKRQTDLQALLSHKIVSSSLGGPGLLLADWFTTNAEYTVALSAAAEIADSCRDTVEVSPFGFDVVSVWIVNNTKKNKAPKIHDIVCPPVTSGSHLSPLYSYQIT